MGDVVSADIVFQDAATAAGNGNSYSAHFANALVLEVSGTSSSRTVKFEEQGISGAWYACAGVKRSDLSFGSETTGIDELWEFDLRGRLAFRARVSAVAGGNVTVKGRAIVSNG